MDTKRLGESLLGAFAQVPDPRSRHGRRHPLGAVLALSVCAMLSGARSLYAIAQWGRMQSAETLRELGFSRDRTPAVSTLHNVFSNMDADVFESALGEWIESRMGSQEEAIAIDGKALRGIHGEELPGVRLVAAYTHDGSLVVGQKWGLLRQARVGVELGEQPVGQYIRCGQGGNRGCALLSETAV